MKGILNSISRNIQQAVAEPDKTVSRTNRELIYGAVACTAVGMVLGLLLSPKKQTIIGSYNGHNSSGCPAPAENDEEED